MKSTIQSGLLQSCGAKLYMCLLTMSTIIYIASIDSFVRFLRGELLPENNYHTDFIINACYSNTFITFIPIIATLPFSAGYINELKSKYTYYLLVRCNYHQYIISRTIVSFLSGGIAVAAGILLAWVGSFILFYPTEIMMNTISNNASSILLAQITVLVFLCGGFWSVVGMTMSTLMESRYIPYATPFVFYYLLVILYERYFSDLFIIYPKTWTDPTAWPFGCWGAAIFLLEMTLIFAFLFAYRAGRRLQQL